MTRQQESKLCDHFIARAGIPQNRPSMNWTFKDILKDFTPQQAKEIIDFYFDHWSHQTHDFNGLKFHYHEIYAAMHQRSAEIEKIQRMREETNKRVKEWKARFARD